MSDKNYTHILVISDRSGSMGWPIHKHNKENDFNLNLNTSSPAIEMRAALEEVFSSQAKIKGKCLVDFVQFDTVHETVYEDKKIKKATVKIEPRGGTALNDAIGFAVTNLEKKLKALPKVHQPRNVLVIILTDGIENSSIVWHKPQVKQLIEKQTEKGWVFTFLGANMDAVAEAFSYGVPAGNALTYNSANIMASSAVLDNFTTNVRDGSFAAGTYRGYSDEERDKQFEEV